MSWIEYRQSYYSYATAAAQVRILGLAVDDVFREFPKRLPEDAQKSLFSGLLDAFRTVQELVAQAQPGVRSEQIRTINGYEVIARKDLSIPKIVPPLVDLLFFQAELGRKGWDVEFSQLIRSQEIILMCALLDAFLGKSLEAIVPDRSSVANRGGVMQQLATLQGNLAGQFAVLPEERSFLEYATQVRNLLVHRAGIVDERFRKQVNRAKFHDQEEGGTLRIADGFVADLYDLCNTLAGELFVAVAQVKYRIDVAAHSTVVRRGEIARSTQGERERTH